MSTSAVSGSSLNLQLQQYFQTRHTDLQQLGQALGSGDLAGAQTAYGNIVALGQNGPFSGGNPFVFKNREQDFSAIGQALQAGDLAGAQQALSTLKSTFQKAANPQAVPSTAPASSSGPEIIVNLSTGGSNGASPASSTTPSASASPAPGSGPEIILNLSNNGSSSPEQITIDINSPAGGGGEQVSLSVGNQGSNAQEITFNLSPNSNEQIVLNLLGQSSPASSASGSSSSSGGLSVSA